ncbi:MAG: CARDB domain-containing protein, partial [Thermodesulfovibrionales bacterium]
QASAGGHPFDSPLANYVAAGGRAILADWRRDATVGAACEGSDTGANDQSPIFTDGHPVWVGLPGTINLSNPGWLIWSMGLAPIGGGVATGTFPNGNAVVIEGNSGRTLLNGMLDDTFATFSEGVTFAENEIKYICGGGPDLIISNLIAKIRTYGTPMIRGVFVNYTVTNQGNGNSNASCLDFYLSRDTVLDGGDVYVGTANIPALGAGGSYSNVKGYTLPPSKWQQASGTWRVIGVADACDDNDESDETNNQLAVVAGIVVK